MLLTARTAIANQTRVLSETIRPILATGKPSVSSSDTELLELAATDLERLWGMCRQVIFPRRTAYGALFVLVGISMSVLIWVGCAFAIRYLLLWWREERLPSTMAWGETISKIKVLIVDYHAIVRDGIRTMLALQPDMQVVRDAANGGESLGKTVELHPNVVLMDIRMPEMNGFDAAREICQKCPEVKVLMLSQYDEEENILASRQVGALGFIPKQERSKLPAVNRHKGSGPREAIHA